MRTSLTAGKAAMFAVITLQLKSGCLKVASASNGKSTILLLCNHCHWQSNAMTDVTHLACVAVSCMVVGVLHLTVWTDLVLCWQPHVAPEPYGGGWLGQRGAPHPS